MSEKASVGVVESPHVSTLRPVAWKALALDLCLEDRLDGSRCAEGGDTAALVPVCMLRQHLVSGQSVHPTLCSPQL